MLDRQTQRTLDDFRRRRELRDDLAIEVRKEVTRLSMIHPDWPMDYLKVQAEASLNARRKKQ